ncbi:hypothetical protein [Streptomyces sp. NPDC020681]|uniref:hypothetical protein n=1 Tax=Streptomyces sp. NPDC020681 TaxID=3365083 RepID=UPI0037877AB9
MNNPMNAPLYLATRSLTRQNLEQRLWANIEGLSNLDLDLELDLDEVPGARPHLTFVESSDIAA